jgi:hypothetical protein
VAKNRNRPSHQQRQARAPHLPEQPQPAPELPAVGNGETPVDAAQEEKAALDALLAQLEQARSSRVLVYWTSPIARIADPVVIPLFDQLSAIGKTDRLDLFLQTGGGDVEVPWRVVSLVREYCDHFAVIVPHRAASAGTLLALGADEIVMTPLSVLGPIDPSRGHPLLPRREGQDEAEPISVQDMRHAMQFIREAAGSATDNPYTPEALAQIFAALFDKIHPLVIGAIEQSYALSKLIGTRCLETHMTADGDAAKIEQIVDTLCDDFKSHAYQIPRGEAKKVGLKVSDATEPEQAAITDLLKFYLQRPFMPTQQPKPGQPFQHRIGWLDSTTLHMTVESSGQVDNEGRMKSLGDKWIAY